MGALFVALAFLGDALYELDPNLMLRRACWPRSLGGLNSFQFGPDGMLYAPVMEKGQVVRIDVDADPIEIEVVAEGLAGLLPSSWIHRVACMQTEIPTPNHWHRAYRHGTGEIETFAAVPSGIDNFAFDAHDRLFVSLLAEGTIAEVIPDGPPHVGAVGMVSPAASPCTPDGESIFVADLWMLQEFDSATGRVACAK